MAWTDFLQMNPENIAKARNTTWGSAIAQDFNPRNINYQGFQTHPANVAQSSRVGLGSYINQGLRSLTGKFTGGSNVGGATTLMRKIAMSPFGKVAGAAFSLPAAAAYATYKTPAMIDYLTKRDPNATKSSLFGIDLTQNANEQAALPDVGANAWSEMGPIPDGGVVPPIENINKPLPDNIPFDPDQGNIPYVPAEKKGFNFSDFGMSGILKAIGGERSKEKQAAYEAIMGDNKGGLLVGDPMKRGMYQGTEYGLRQTPSGLKLYSEVNPYGVNFDSKWGSKTVEESDERTLQRAQDRLRKGKAISQRLRNILSNRGRLTPKGLTKPGEDGVTTAPIDTGGAVNTGWGSVDTSGWSSPGYSTRGGFSAPAQSTGTQHSGAGTSDVRGHHGNFSQGGRIGYRDGEFVDEDINIEGPGYDFNENIEAVQGEPSQEQLEVIAFEIFRLPLEQLSEPQLEIVYRTAMQQEPSEEQVQFAAQEGPGEGIASLV